MSDRFPVDRVIAALDAGCRDLELLPAAAEMAARLKAEVAGLFIEDENLLRLWALPAARHVRLGASGRELPTATQIEAELRALAAQAEAALRAAAARHGVPWSFRVVRGRPEQELHDATMSTDLVLVGRARDLPGGLPLQLSSPLQEAVRRLTRSTLHLRRPTSLTRPIVVAEAHSPLLDRALAAAVRLAGPAVREMEILLIGEPATTERARGEIARRLAQLGYGVRVLPTAAATVEQIGRALAGAEGDILVAAADVPVFRDRDEMSRLLERTGLPIMIVRA